MTNTNKTNNGSFLVRAPKEEIEEFNKVVEKRGINRAALFRIWIRKYIEENK